MRHVLALDQGTTSSRAIVFRPDGSVAGSAQEPFEQHFPAPGRIEHDPEEIWRTQSRVAGEAVARAGLAAADIAAVGITNQRETVVAWDRATGQPIGRAIVWQDRRTAADCERLRISGVEPWVRERTGLLLDPYFSATKMRWMLDHVPGLRSRAEAGTARLGTIDSWLLARLTGGAVHATDPTNAGRTLLFDIRRGEWDPELLELFGVPPACLPHVQPSASDFGTIVAGHGAPVALAGIPIAGVAGDQQAALLGQGGIAAGDAKNTYGTGCFLLVHTGGTAPPPPAGILATPAASLDEPAFAREGSVFIGGALVEWLRDGLGIIRESGEIQALAASVPDTGGVMLVPALAGLGAPWWDPRARGTILGLTRGTSRAHIARAALEGIAHSVADLLDAMTDTTPRPTQLRVDGAAAANDLLMQIQADLLGVDVIRPPMVETTALGAAILAAHATGAWDEPLAATASRRVDHRFTPRIGDVERRRTRERWRTAVDRSRDWEHDEDDE